MKTVVKNSIRILLILMVVFTNLCFPLEALAAAKVNNSKATTLKELKAELTALQNKKKDLDKQKTQTKSQINQKNLDIKNANDEIKKSENKIVEAKNDIAEAEKTIKDYKTKSEELMKFYQIMSSENAYVDFFTDSSNMTELIMRMDAVDRILAYNKEMLDTLDRSIKELEQKQVELKKYETELENNIASYEQKIKELDSRYLALMDDGIDINEEIYNIKETIQYYVNLGCKDNDRLDVCSSNVNNPGWLKPVSKGRINSLFGWRTLSGKANFHSGIDIGVSEGTKVYAVAAGTVFNVVYKSSCGGNKVYVQCIVAGQKYTVSYVHLLSINVKKGDKVTTDTVIGKSGGYTTAKRYGGYDTCTTGAHLHVSVSKGYYTSYANYVANLINPPGYPGKGSWFYSRTQWFNN